MPEQKSEAPEPKTRVLLIQADPLLRVSFARVLRAAGFVVVEAATREQAEEQLQARRVDAVTFDYETPGGPELLQLARSFEHVSRVVFADAPRGSERWLERPVDSAELVAALRAR